MRVIEDALYKQSQDELEMSALYICITSDKQNDTHTHIRVFLGMLGSML